MKEHPPAPPGVSFRAVVLGLLLTPLNAFWVLRMEEVLYGPYPSLLSLFANAIFGLFALAAINTGVRRAAPRFAFGQGELLIIYTILAISTAMAGQSGLNIVCGIIGHGTWFATPENGWADLERQLPTWMIIQDREILTGHYLGHANLYRPEVLRAWATPVLAWTTLFCLICWVAYCVNALVRRQWADREKLTFPILALPLAMTEGGTGAALFGNRLLWIGFAVAFLLNLWNGVAFLDPRFPTIPLGIVDLKPLMTEKPWRGIDWFPLTLYPMAIGLSYLLPLDLLFSCWFFFLFWKSQQLVSNAFAWDNTRDFPFIKEQGFGAVIALFVYYLWSGRKSYAAIWRSALSGKIDPDAPLEGLSERGALIGIAVGTVGLLAFCLAMRVTWWVALAFFALYLPTLAVVARIRAELGSPVHDFSFFGPDNMLSRSLGTGAFTPRDLGFFALSYPLTYSRSNDPMPVALESLQAARMTRMNARKMFGVLLIATVWGTLCTFWAYEHQAYTLGTATRFYAGTHFASETYERFAAWSAGTLDPRPNQAGATAIAVGFVTSLLLLVCRLRFIGFPLHPIGYAVSSAWAINLVWLPMLIAWMVKSLTLRYGGLSGYRRSTPFYLGLILGDCVMGSLWGVLAVLLDSRMYNFFGA